MTGNKNAAADTVITIYLEQVEQLPKNFEKELLCEQSEINLQSEDKCFVFLLFSNEK